MRRLHPAIWSALFSVLVCTIVGIPVALDGFGDGSLTTVPGWTWNLAYVAFLALMLLCHWHSEAIDLTRTRVMFGIQILLGQFLVLTAPGAGWIQILLVFTAALSVYLVPMVITAMIIVANSAAIAAGIWLSDQPLSSVWLGAAIYTMLQVATVLSQVALRHEERMRRELAVAHTELRAATALLAESSRSTERLRISRELHDVLGHQLTALSLELQVAAHHARPPAEEHVRRGRDIARELLSDVRDTVGQLRRNAPDLRESLRRLVADLPQPHIELRVDESLDIDEDRATALLRCVQEIVTNTIRHSEAETLWIDVVADDDMVRLTAVDDGRCSPHFVQGNGMRGIAERVAELGGAVKFTVEGSLRVEATVPS